LASGVNICLSFPGNWKKEAEKAAENKALGRYRDFPARRRILERILQKLSNEDLPGMPYLEQYFRHLHRRDLTANTLRAAEARLRGFLTFLPFKKSLADQIVEDLRKAGLK
jgi:hypothetical protein